MHTLAALLTLALAVSASALAHPNPAAPAVTTAPLMGRDNTDTARECAKAVASIATGIPSAADASLARWLDSNDGLNSALSSIQGAKPVSDVAKVCSALLVTSVPPGLTSAMS